MITLNQIQNLLTSKEIQEQLSAQPFSQFKISASCEVEIDIFRERYFVKVIEKSNNLTTELFATLKRRSLDIECQIFTFRGRTPMAKLKAFFLTLMKGKSTNSTLHQCIIYDTIRKKA